MNTFLKKQPGISLMAAALLCIGLTSCSEDYTFTAAKIEGVEYDPSKAVTVEQILPDSGVYLTQFVIKGSNFGMDPSKITVTFNGNRKATVVSTNGSDIYGITPKQADGDNTVAVTVADKEPVTLGTTFHYTKKEQVTTVVGTSGGGFVDGTLSEAKLSYMHGVGVVTGGNIVIADGRYNNSVRMVSPEDDKVVTLYTGAWCGKPAVSHDGTKFYMCQKVKPHQIWCFDQSNSWMPKRLTSSIDNFDGEIYSLAMDDTDDYLYFREHNGKLGRMEIANPENVEILNENCGQVSKECSYLVWSPVDKCFFLSLQNAQGIYKVSADGKTVEEYAGFNNVGGTDGYRTDAQFKNPAGLTVDQDGNLYICDSMGFSIRKLDHETGMISTVAGAYTQEGGAGKTGIDGDPLDARFSYPYDISVDDEGNFWIVEGWGSRLRKYAIE